MSQVSFSKDELGVSQQSIETESLANWMALSEPLAPAGTAGSAAVTLFRVREIFAGEASDYRRCLTNFYAAFDASAQAALVYLVEGGPQGVALYFGVMGSPGDLREASKFLISAIEGQLPGLALDKVEDEQARQRLASALQSHQRGLMLGVPAVDEERQTELDAQGIERLVRALLVSHEGRSGERWRLLIVAKPLPRAEVRALFEETLALTTEVAARVRTSLQLQTHSGEQTSLTRSESDTLATSTARTKQSSWNTSTSTSDQRTKSESGSETTSRSSSSSTSQQVSN